METVLRERLRAQGLTGPGFDAPEEAVGRILAVQAQDRRGFRLAVRSRTRGVAASDLDRSLTERRSLVVSWLNRGTLHLVGSEDYPWLHALIAPRLVKGNARQLEAEGISPADAERAAEVVTAALGSDGPSTRADLRERLDSAGIPTAGQALYHLLVYVGLGGSIVRGPMVGGEQAFVLTEDWLGPQPRVDVGKALAELARRYLAGHGPASDRDLAYWTGITLTQARRGLKEIGDELVEAAGGLLDLRRSSGSSARPELPPPRLLGPFDPVLHGWPSRELLIPEGEGRSVVTVNGLFRPTILVEGRVAGIWRSDRGEIRLEPFVPLDPAAEAALQREAVAIDRYLTG